MKTTLVAFCLLAALAPHAVAGPCDDDVARLARALAKDKTTPDQHAQIEDMLTQAKNLCKAGNEQEGLDVLAEAKAMLSIE